MIQVEATKDYIIPANIEITKTLLRYQKEVYFMRLYHIRVRQRVHSVESWMDAAIQLK